MTQLNLARSRARRQLVERLRELESERRVLIEAFPALAIRPRTYEPNGSGAERRHSSSGASRRSSRMIPTEPRIVN
jgi:hypothetical protein